VNRIQLTTLSQLTTQISMKLQDQAPWTILPTSLMTEAVLTAAILTMELRRPKRRRKPFQETYDRTIRQITSSSYMNVSIRSMHESFLYVNVSTKRKSAFGVLEPPVRSATKDRTSGKLSSCVVWYPPAKTYNRRDSQMVTHSSTNRPVQCLCMAERTGCPVFTDLWSYVK
jgi:hypothetical protein